MRDSPFARRRIILSVRTALARSAPAQANTSIAPGDPPLLILHDDRDGVAPLDQAETLHARLTEAGISATLVTVRNGNHKLQGARSPPRKRRSTP